MKIAIIGSNPSKFNLNPNIPFVGTRSHTRLKKWITFISQTTGISEDKFDLYNVSNKVSEKEVKYTNEELTELYQICLDYDFVISLGNNVEKACKKVGIFSYKMPHPSHRNRILNNQEKEKLLLEEACARITLVRDYWRLDPNYDVIH